MRRSLLIFSARFLLTGFGCFHHHSYDTEVRQDKNSVHVRAPYADVNVHWDDRDHDDEDDTHVEVDVDD
jgi:hypothetical protein